MELEKLKEVELELKRFKSRLEDAKRRISEKDYSSFSGTKETGALKRARLDLQNILVKNLK